MSIIMKILWFEVTTPSQYTGQGLVIGGWQDSLERIVRTCPDIELYIAFESQWPQEKKVIDGVTYIPLNVAYTLEEKKRAERNWQVNAEKLIPEIRKAVEEISPDLIQVFGTEWPFGIIAEYTDIPVVVHIQGAIVSYNNALFPPRYNFFDVVREIGWTHPKRIRKAWYNHKFDLSRLEIELRVWKAVKYYMGRTNWDYALSEVMHPGRKYFHVEEALRPHFIRGNIRWNPSVGGKLRLISTGCSNFWKGPDMLIKCANILKGLGIDFEWNVAGYMPDSLRHIVEKKECMSFEENNVKFLGYIQPEELIQYLRTSTIYVHTAYVENSPNSICEAQCIGIPIISTNVGGISTLLRDGEEGILVPANDPWQMAYAIKELYGNKHKMINFSETAKTTALRRHNDINIKQQLLEVYRKLIYNK